MSDINELIERLRATSPTTEPTDDAVIALLNEAWNFSSEEQTPEAWQDIAHATLAARRSLLRGGPIMAVAPIAPSPQGNDGLIERLRMTGCEGCLDAADALAAQQQRYQDEHEIVDRVWKALGITTYQGANGKAIHEIVAEQKDALAAAEKDIVLRETERQNILAAIEKHVEDAEELLNFASWNGAS